MEQREFPRIGEKLLTETLPNGLKVVILPKPDFHKTFAIFSTNYGAIDQKFRPAGGKVVKKYPVGIAHFLEHKLFEKKDHDAFDLFAKSGADANAFTTYTKTSYLFSSTHAIHENLDILLNFVQEPYFTSKSVDKEKGIIAQEIKMYADEPDWKGEMGIIGNLFPNHPVRFDIAGSVQSIQNITAEELYEAYHTFYAPKNMTLFVAGPTDPEMVLDWIKTNQAHRNFEFNEIPERENSEDQTPQDIILFRLTEMPIIRSKIFVGIKGPNPSEISLIGLKQKIQLQLLFQALFGVSSHNFATLYKQGLIDDSFGYEVDYERSFNFGMLYGDTHDPAQLSDTILNLLENAASNPDLTEVHLERLKKKQIGEFLYRFNSVEAIANAYNNNDFNDGSVFDVLDIIDRTTIDDLQQLASIYFQSNNTSVYHVVPKK